MNIVKENKDFGWAISLTEHGYVVTFPLNKSEDAYESLIFAMLDLMSPPAPEVGYIAMKSEDHLELQQKAWEASNLQLEVDMLLAKIAEMEKQDLRMAVVDLSLMLLEERRKK